MKTQPNLGELDNIEVEIGYCLPPLNLGEDTANKTSKLLMLKEPVRPYHKGNMGDQNSSTVVDFVCPPTGNNGLECERMPSVGVRMNNEFGDFEPNVWIKRLDEKAMENIPDLRPQMTNAMDVPKDQILFTALGGPSPTSHPQAHGCLGAPGPVIKMSLYPNLTVF